MTNCQMYTEMRQQPNKTERIVITLIIQLTMINAYVFCLYEKKYQKKILV